MPTDVSFLYFFPLSDNGDGTYTVLAGSRPGPPDGLVDQYGIRIPDGDPVAPGELTENGDFALIGLAYEAADFAVVDGVRLEYVGATEDGGFLYRDVDTGQVTLLTDTAAPNLMGTPDPVTFKITISWDAGQTYTALSEDFTCFGAGTMIATPGGETPVEDLRPGDLVLTADGRAVPVIWIGRQTRDKRFTARDRITPVRVRAGALAPGVPHSDLTLTADHALILDALAINAGALVNGDTIVWETWGDLPQRVTTYHVETAAHEVLLANGAPAESYVDYVSRARFDNFDPTAAGADRVIAEMPLPRIATPRLLPAHLRPRHRA